MCVIQSISTEEDSLTARENNTAEITTFKHPDHSNKTSTAQTHQKTSHTHTSLQN